MVFDECPPGDAGIDVTRKSLELTATWAARSKSRFDELQSEPPALAGECESISRIESISSRPLTQAVLTCRANKLFLALFKGLGILNLRKESLDRTVEIGFDGYAIGGLSVGEEKSVMYEVLDFIAPKMPANAPRYLMGVGTPEDLIEAVNCGVDMFDCVIPTRNGRTGKRVYVARQTQYSQCKICR